MRIKFSIRDLFWALLCVGLACGWMLTLRRDRQKLLQTIEDYEVLRIEHRAELENMKNVVKALDRGVPASTLERILEAVKANKEARSK